MHDLQDPRNLSLGQVFRQARMLARQTSRASNPDWYRPGLELDRQWHILIDGQGPAKSFVYDRRSGSWGNGPELGEANFREGESDREEPRDQSLEEGLLAILDDARFATRPRSVGVIVHVADEMGIAELSQEFSAETDFEMVRAALEEAPRQVIADSTLNLEAHAWKLLPQWGVRHGDRRSIAIRISRRLDSFLRRLAAFAETRDVPVIPHLLCAPLAALTMLPVFLDEISGEGAVVIFHYPRMTVVSVMDASAEILQIRVLPHRRGTAYPADISEVVGNAAASANLKLPKVHVVAMGAVNSETLLREMMAAGAPTERFGIGMIERTPEVLGFAPEGRPEFMIGNLAGIRNRMEQSSLFRSHSFAELARGWGAQNFDRQGKERGTLYPSRGELVLLKLIDKAKITFATLALCVSIVATYEGAGISGRPGTGTNRASLEAMRVELEKLGAEDRRITYWESMLQPRSEGWAALELVLRMIPPDGSILLTSCEYNASGEPPRNRAVKQIGFQRQWTLKGYCRSGARPALSLLSSNQHIRGVFEAMAQDFARDAFRAKEKSRNLSVTMQQRQGEYPPNGILSANAARLYNTCFDIRVTQTFGDKDELAILLGPPRSAQQGGNVQ